MKIKLKIAFKRIYRTSRYHSDEHGDKNMLFQSNISMKDLPNIGMISKNKPFTWN